MLMIGVMRSLLRYYIYNYVLIIFHFSKKLYFKFMPLASAIFDLFCDHVASKHHHCIIKILGHNFFNNVQLVGSTVLSLYSI